MMINANEEMNRVYWQVKEEEKRDNIRKTGNKRKENKENKAVGDLLE